jgi:hypothetical protein
MFRNFSPDCCLWSFERVRLGPQCPAVIGLLAVVLSVSPVVVNAQTSSSIAGVVAGRVMNEQVWNSEYQTEKVGGVQVGGFLNARTSVPWFEMRAEFMWTQRGGSVVGDLRGGELIGEARTDYMTVAVQPRFAARRGLVEVFATAGPVIDVVLRNRFSPELGLGLQEVAQVFGAGVGAGFAATLPSSFHAEIEVRVFEGLGDAYSGDFVSAKNRSSGLVLRFGRTLSR